MGYCSSLASIWIWSIDHDPLATTTQPILCLPNNPAFKSISPQFRDKICPYEEEVKQKHQKACMDKQGAPGQTQKGNLQRVG